MKTSDFIREHDACREGAKWALSVSPDMSAVWDDLVKQGKHEWLLWTATRQGVFTESILRKLACRFVRETPLLDGRKVWDLLTDKRSRRAIEVADAFANGNATEAELSAACEAAYSAHAVDWAANAAARAAYYAAYSAAARAACDAYDSANAAADAAAWAAADAALAAARAAAEAAQVRMIAELGNPFRKESVK